MHTFGRQKVYIIYPRLTPDMSYYEKSYGFWMVIKLALKPVGIPLDQMLQILAGVTRTAPLVSGLQSKFITFAKNTICQAGNLSRSSHTMAIMGGL
jgi:hypothetical protein